MLKTETVISTEKQSKMVKSRLKKQKTEKAVVEKQSETEMKPVMGSKVRSQRH